MIWCGKINAYRTRPEGRIIIRDFAKPEREGPVYMQIQTDDGFNNVSEASVKWRNWLQFII